MYFTPFLQKRHCVCSRAPGGPARLLRVCRKPAAPDSGLPRCGVTLLAGFLFCVLAIFCPYSPYVSMGSLVLGYPFSESSSTHLHVWNLKTEYHLHRHCRGTVFLLENRPPLLAFAWKQRGLHFARFVRHLASARRGGTESFQL